MKTFPALLTALLIASAMPSTGRAASLSGLIITPALRQLSVANGFGQTEVTFEVGNYTGSARTLDLRIADFTASAQTSGTAQLSLDGGAPSGGRYGLAAWASIDRNAVTLQPGSTQDVTVRINDDASLLAGGHYGALVITDSGAAQGAGGGRVDISQSLSGLIFLTKTGGEAYGLRLSDLKSSGALTQAGSLVSLRFQNTGNVHVIPRGVVQVYDPRGRLISQGVMNVGSDILLPETSREVSATLAAVSPAGVPGKYSVKVTYHRDGNDALSVSTLSFVYVPPRILFISAGLLALGASLLSMLSSRRIKHAGLHRRRTI